MARASRPSGPSSSSTSTASSTAPGRRPRTRRTFPRRTRITPDIIAEREAARAASIIRAVHPLERLINLTALLLNAHRPLTFDEIRERIEAYRHGDAASAKRMFERDKDVLREAGVPVDLAATDVWDVEKGYRIDPSKYYLPDLAFTREETWALFVAAHAPGEDPEAE